jgi:hypothetical protein
MLTTGLDLQLQVNVKGASSPSKLLWRPRSSNFNKKRRAWAARKRLLSK